MGLDPKQVRDWVVRPALRALGAGAGGLVAEKLVFATGLQESDGFRYIHQLGKGPALGLFQIEPVTLMDTLRRAREEHLMRLDAYRPGVLPLAMFNPERVVADLGLAAACCRLVYYYKPFPMPFAGDLASLWAVYKTYYNSIRGKATVEEWTEKWRKYKVDDLFKGES